VLASARVAILAAVAVAVAAVAPAAGAPAAIPRARAASGACDRHPGTAILTTRAVIVYRTAAGIDRLGQRLTQEWACARPDGAAMKLGRSASGGPLAPDEVTTHLTTAGSAVGAFVSSGAGAAAACARLRRRSCPRAHHKVVLLNPAAGDRSSVSCGPRIGRLLVGAVGITKAAVVWTQPAGRSATAVWAETLVASTSGASSASGTGGLVARGAISPGSLRLAGLRLRYAEAGKAHAVTLTGTSASADARAS
jgi:hypothetical protein